jgi:hypothetical protein
VTDAGAQVAGEVKEAVHEKVEQAKEAGTQLADDAAQKAEEVKDAAYEKVEQAKEAGAQLADDAAKSGIVESAIHAKDVAVEKAQEIGHAVSANIYSYSLLEFRFLFRLLKQYKTFRQQLLMLLVRLAKNSQLLDNGLVFL